MSKAFVNSIAELKKSSDSSGRIPSWAKQHLAAWISATPHEHGIQELIVALAHYGDAHARKFESKIGEDNFLGPAFQRMAESIITLLNGDLGRFDGGTLDALVRAICTEHGVELDQ